MSTLPLEAEVFYSYANVDESFCKDLENHLSLLRHEGLITTWHQRQVSAGADWKRFVDHHLNTASVILLLISPDFLASDYYYGIEMQRAMQRHEAGEAHVVPILLRPVDWQGAPFGKLKVLPSNGKPISVWENRDLALLDVARGIRSVIEGMPPFSACTSPISLSQESVIPKPSPPQFSLQPTNNVDYSETATESDYAQYQEKLYRELKMARLQANPPIPSVHPPKYKIDKSFFVKFNLSDQRVKFLTLLEEQLRKRNQGASTCAVTADARNLLRGYILQCMVLELERRNGRGSLPPYEVFLTSHDIREGERGIERKVLSTFGLNHITDLFVDNAHEDIILVIWHDSCPTKWIRPPAHAFETKLKGQVQEILCQQNRCLLLFWVTVDQPVLNKSIALPLLDHFDTETLTLWLNEQLEKQLKFQGASESIISGYLTTLKSQISKWEGHPGHTYEILQDFLAQI